MAAKSVASRGGPPGQNADSIPPNQTLYVRGFSDKLQKEEVRRVLYMLFNTYGPVMDINIMKTVKMHGQAHIVMKDIQTATHAMRQTDGIEFLGGTLSVQYAKSKSHFIAKIDGTYKSPVAAAKESAAAAAAEPTSELSALQASIFNQPPGQAPSLPAKPPTGGETVATDATAETRGTKRAAEGEPEGARPMKAATPNPPSIQEEEEDDEDAMEMSDEDD